MKTAIVSQNQMEEIIETLNNHHVVAFPTETVYGLGVVFNSVEALNELLQSKNRDVSKAFTLMLCDIKQIEQYAYVTQRDLQIIQAFMPGKITVILNKRDNVTDQMTSGKKTIGIRIPDSAFVLSLIEKVGPMLVTSANISGGLNTTTTTEVLEQLEGRIPMIVDGQSGDSVASTVVDLSSDKIQILRQGDISLEMIKEAIK